MTAIFLNFLTLQILAHILIDFYLQNDTSVEEKQEKGLKSKSFQKHIIGVFLLSAIFSFQLNFILYALLIAIFHLLIDVLKNTMLKTKLKPYAFYIDQLLHLLVILGVVMLYFNSGHYSPMFSLDFNPKYLSIPIAFLMVMKPANIFIRELFETFQFDINFENELPNAGRIIGSLERIFILVLIFSQQYAGVGFLIFAKSILRYKSDSKKAEYVLIGTMLSALVAIFTALLALGVEDLYIRLGTE